MAVTYGFCEEKLSGRMRPQGENLDRNDRVPALQKKNYLDVASSFAVSCLRLLH